MRQLTILAASACATLILSSCASRPAQHPVEEYLAIVGSSDSRPLTDPAVKRFADFYSDITEASIHKKLRSTYAEDVFFNDTLKTIRGTPGLEKYFLNMASHTEFVRVRVLDSSRSGKEHYVRWVMDVRFKGSSKTIRTIGMTHLRADESGKITLHQDFWDSTAGFFEHVPFLGTKIRWIKSLL